MLPNSLFVMFAAFAAPELAGQPSPFDFRVVPQPGEVDAEFDERAPADEFDLDTFDSPDNDGLAPRDNPHHPAPNSNPCKKKEHEPKGCPGGPK